MFVRRWNASITKERLAERGGLDNDFSSAKVTGVTFDIVNERCTEG